MNYTQAKLAAVDLTIDDPKHLNDAASLLLARLDATDDDMNDAYDLIDRANRLLKRP